jgi:hypothetical protein
MPISGNTLYRIGNVACSVRDSILLALEDTTWKRVMLDQAEWLGFENFLIVINALSFDKQNVPVTTVITRALFSSLYLKTHKRREMPSSYLYAKF